MEVFRGDSFGCAIDLEGPETDPRLSLEGHRLRERYTQRRLPAHFPEDGRRRLSREAGFAIGRHQRRCPGAAGSLGRLREEDAGEQVVRVRLDGGARVLQVCDRVPPRLRRVSRHQRGDRCHDQSPASWERHPGNGIQNSTDLPPQTHLRSSARPNSSFLACRTPPQLSYSFVSGVVPDLLPRSRALRIQRCLQKCLAGILHVQLPNKAWMASSGLHERKGGLGIRDNTIHTSSTDALGRGIWPNFEAVVDSAIPCARAVFPAVHRLNASWRPDGTAYSQSYMSSIFDAHVLNHLLRDASSG